MGTIPYSDEDDTFNGRTLLNHSTKSDTRIYMSSLTNSRRATRDPIFHDNNFDDEDILNNRTNSVEIPKISGPISRLETSDNRSHLLDNSTVNRLRQLLILGACSGAFPWTWNKKEYRIDKWRPLFEKLWNVQWFFVTIQTACITVFQFYSFIHRVQGQNKTYREVFMNSFSVYWYVCCVYFNVNMFIYKDRVKIFKYSKPLQQKHVITKSENGD